MDTAAAAADGAAAAFASGAAASTGTHQSAWDTGYRADRCCTRRVRFLAWDTAEARARYATGVRRMGACPGVRGGKRSPADAALGSVWQPGAAASEGAHAHALAHPHAEARRIASHRIASRC